MIEDKALLLEFPSLPNHIRTSYIIALQSYCVWCRRCFTSLFVCSGCHKSRDMTEKCSIWVQDVNCLQVLAIFLTRNTTPSGFTFTWMKGIQEITDPIDTALKRRAFVVCILWVEHIVVSRLVHDDRNHSRCEAKSPIEGMNRKFHEVWLSIWLSSKILPSYLVDILYPARTRFSHVSWLVTPTTNKETSEAPTVSLITICLLCG